MLCYYYSILNFIYYIFSLLKNDTSNLQNNRNLFIIELHLSKVIFCWDYTPLLAYEIDKKLLISILQLHSCFSLQEFLILECERRLVGEPPVLNIGFLVWTWYKRWRVGNWIGEKWSIAGLNSTRLVFYYLFVLLGL